MVLHSLIRSRPLGRCIGGRRGSGAGQLRIPSGRLNVHQKAADVVVERSQWEDLARSLQRDAERMVESVGQGEVSVLLCGIDRIRDLNRQWRDKDEPTDVLSFPDGTGETLGDIAISVHHAEKVGAERGVQTQEEARVLLAHGIAHLLGEDHEQGDRAAARMQELERTLLASCESEGDPLTNRTGHSSSDKTIKLAILDLDGTLLRPDSTVGEPTKEALLQAISEGVIVCVATGKARPSASEILGRVGLTGEGLVVSSKGPGVFLQGLNVQGRNGERIHSASLPESVVRWAFQQDYGDSVGLTAFCGDECRTIGDPPHPNILHLHDHHREPYPTPVDSIEDLIADGPVNKLLFYADSSEEAQGKLRPKLEQAMGHSADVTVAIPEMVEVVPVGSSKGKGVEIMVEDLGFGMDEVMAVGDGENDLDMLQECGLGVAVANAKEPVKRAANVVLETSNAEDASADALARFVLSESTSCLSSP